MKSKTRLKFQELERFIAQKYNDVLNGDIELLRAKDLIREEMIKLAIEVNPSISAAARFLNVKRTTLAMNIKKSGLEPPKPPVKRKKKK